MCSRVLFPYRIINYVHHPNQPPYSALKALATTLNSPTCSIDGPFSSMDPRRGPPSLPGAPSMKTSVSPGSAPFTRPVPLGSLGGIPPVNFKYHLIPPLLPCTHSPH